VAVVGWQVVVRQSIPVSIRNVRMLSRHNAAIDGFWIPAFPAGMTAGTRFKSHTLA
jgi:hypothetical protein